MNWILAAKLSSIARWADAARRPSRSCNNRDSRKCIIWRAGLMHGRREWIRKCQSTKRSSQSSFGKGAPGRSLLYLLKADLGWTSPHRRKERAFSKGPAGGGAISPLPGERHSARILRIALTTIAGGAF